MRGLSENAGIQFRTASPAPISPAKSLPPGKLETADAFGTTRRLTGWAGGGSYFGLMKKRGFFAPIRDGGVLRWSTLCILTSGMVGCESKYVATAQDEKVAQLQSQIEALDAQKARLMNGEVANNFELPGVGFYHAEARDFFEHPYGFEKDGKWFANGKWQDQAVGEATVAASRPTPEALKKVDAALEKEQQLLASQGKAAGTPAGSTNGNQSHGSGFGSALMMYWLLAGNRGSFGPGAGFQRAGTQVSGWQQGVEQQRQTVSSHAAANPGYQRMVNDSRSRGVPVKAGQSVRGGFGSSGRTSSAT